MSKWSEKSVEEIALDAPGAIKIGPFGSQLHKREMRPEGFKVYGQENVIENSFFIGDRFISPGKFHTLRSCQLFPGDLVVTMMGTVGKIAIVPEGIAEGVMDSHLLRIQLNPRTADSSYVARVLSSSAYIARQIQNLSQGGIMSGLNAGIVRKLRLPLPPLDEQRRIAAILDASEATIRATEAVIEKLLTQIAGLTGTLFGSLLQGPSIRLQDLARDERESFIDGDWIEAPFITTSGIRLIQTGNIGVGDFIEKEDSRRYISKRSFDKLGCKWVKPGDILVCRLADPIGRACEVPLFVGPSVTAVDCTIFRPDEMRVARRYILHWLNSAYSLKSAADIAGGSTRQRISRGNLGGLSVPLPSLAVQESLAATLDAAHGLVASEKFALAKLRLQHQGLLHDLLTGAVRTRP